MRSGQGNPDEARSARYILKDYVNGKLLFCHSPPGVSEVEFNQPTYKNALVWMAGKKRAPVTRVGKDSDTFVPSNVPTSNAGSILPAQGQGARSRAIDQSFFESNTNVQSSRPFTQENGKEFSRTTLYPHQNSIAPDGTPINPKHAHLLAVLKNAESGKRHKKMKRVKQRSGKGYDI